MCRDGNLPRQTEKQKSHHAPYLVPGSALAQVCTTGELKPLLGFSDKQETKACGRVTTVCVPYQVEGGQGGGGGVGVDGDVLAWPVDRQGGPEGGRQRAETASKQGGHTQHGTNGMHRCAHASLQAVYNPGRRVGDQRGTVWRGKGEVLALSSLHPPPPTLTSENKSRVHPIVVSKK